MASGLRLRGDDSDAVALNDLVTAAPTALSARYRICTLQDGSAVLFTDAIDTVVAIALQQKTHDVVDEVPELGGVEVGDQVIGVRSVFVADGLLAAIPTRQVVERELPDEVLFLVEGDAVCARLLERLVLLGRDDALIGRLVRPTSSALLGVRLRHPPWWLLSRVSDGDEPGVTAMIADRGPAAPGAVASTATALSAPASLYVQHGRRHPLSRLLTTALSGQQEVGLLWASGVLERVRAPWEEQSILGAMVPTLPPTTTTTSSTMTPTTDRFAVQLRLGHGSDDGEEPELFVVDDDGLQRLQGFVETAAADELDRVVLGRLADAAGRSRTVVRELVRASSPRLGSRLQSLLAVSGYVRVPGVEGLFLPPGRRLLPGLRPKALRELLGLRAGDDDGGAVAVMVDEDGDGLKLTALATLDAEPIAMLAMFRLTDRRTVYDRLTEDAVLAFPGVQLERPVRLTPARAPRPRLATVPVVVAPRQPPPTVTAVAAPTLDPRAPAESLVGLQLQEQALQTQVLEAIEDVDLWNRLARVKVALGRDDGVETLATAVFLGAAVPETTLARLVKEGPPLIDLVTIDQPTHLQAIRLCTEVLLLLRARANDNAGLAADLDDDILQQATRILLREGIPIPRRLQWATLLAIARHFSDPIGLTRAKEAVLGALNSRGLTEALDLPRFVRSAVALAGIDDDDTAQGGRARAEQLVVVERCLAQLVPDASSMSDSRGALLKAIFGHGLARLGGPARRILATVDDELPAHDAPVQMLLRLYSARVAFVLTRGTDDEQHLGHGEAWKSEVQQVLQSAARPEDRRVAEWLIKRSAWLRADQVVEAPTGLRPSLLRLLKGATDAAATGTRVDVARVIAEVRAVQGCYDFEVVAALDRLLELALLSGRDDVIAQSATEARDAAAHVRILAHRARLLGVCVRAAAIVDDRALVEACLDDVSAIAGDKNVPSVRDLLLAIRPALMALRRVGATDAARRFLSAFVPLTTSFGRETGPLSAALAQGFLQLGDHDMANSLLERALERVWLPNTAHIDRFEAGLAVVGTLVHWPADERFRLVERFVERLDMFTDTFTTSRWFPTHQLLLAERIVDTLVDDRTVRSDALQGWLDEDEARVRRRILLDWRLQMAG
jgi:hypothetical protein